MAASANGSTSTSARTGPPRPPSPPPSSRWRTIRPWSAPLALQVREITSVSATFVLSSTLASLVAAGTSSSGVSTTANTTARASNSHSHSRSRSDPSSSSSTSSSSSSSEPSFSTLAQATALDDAALARPTATTTAATVADTDGDDLDLSVDAVAKMRSISELLRQGLAVKVNGVPWQRVVVQVDEDTDEDAIVIVYGLMADRQYDIELDVVAGEQPVVSKITTHLEGENDAEIFQSDDEIEPIEAPPAVIQQTATPLATPPITPPQASSALPAPQLSPPQQHPRQRDHPHSTPSPSLSPSLSPSPSPSPHLHPLPLTIEDRAAQLTSALTASTAEHTSLLTQLKLARRDAQKTESALRAEIDTLRRASEKNAAGEQRARQKMLALQEALKRCVAATADAEAQVRVVEGALPPLEARVCAVEAEHARKAEEARVAGERAEEAVRADRKRVAELEGELAGLGNRLEKLGNKREKLAGETVPELEAQLAALALELEQVQQESSAVGAQALGGGDGSGAAVDLRDFDHEMHYPHHYLPQGLVNLAPIPIPNSSGGGGASGNGNTPPGLLPSVSGSAPGGGGVHRATASLGTHPLGALPGASTGRAPLGIPRLPSYGTGIGRAVGMGVGVGMGFASPADPVVPPSHTSSPESISAVPRTIIPGVAGSGTGNGNGHGNGNGNNNSGSNSSGSPTPSTIAPGPHAHSHTRGPSVMSTNTTPAPPITILGRSSSLHRTAPARPTRDESMAMGIPSSVGGMSGVGVGMMPPMASRGPQRAGSLGHSHTRSHPHAHHPFSHPHPHPHPHPHSNQLQHQQQQQQYQHPLGHAHTHPHGHGHGPGHVARPTVGPIGSPPMGNAGSIAGNINSGGPVGAGAGVGGGIIPTAPPPGLGNPLGRGRS